MAGQADTHPWHTLSEAARLTGKSERTIRRKVAGGRLTTKREGDVLWVDLTGIPLLSPDKLAATPDTSDILAERDRLAAERDRLAAEVAHLSQRVDDLTGERDYLRSALATSLSLQQRAIEAPAPGRWRWPWQRD